jgi:hypothetical protein
MSWHISPSVSVAAPRDVTGLKKNLGMASTSTTRMTSSALKRTSQAVVALSCTKKKLAHWANVSG